MIPINLVVSKAFLLSISFLHILYQGTDKIYNIGTVVLTDFSKAFDMIDHNILIQKHFFLSVWEFTDPSTYDCVTLSAIEPNVFVTIKQSQSTKFLVELFLMAQNSAPLVFQVVINEAAQDLGDDMKYWKYVDDLTLAENCSFPQPGGM